MSRIGFAECGWVEDIENPDWRCFFPPRFTNLGTLEPGPSGYAGWQQLTVPNRTAFDMFWRMKTFKVSYNLNSANAGNFAGGATGIQHSLIPNVGFPGDERELPCCYLDIYSWQDPPGPVSTILDVSLFLGGLSGPDDMFYVVRVGGTFGGASFGFGNNPATGDPSAIDCTLFGVNKQLYDFPGDSSSGTINVEADTWWTYDNNLTGRATDGPIYDETTGARLIPIIPSGN